MFCGSLSALQRPPMTLQKRRRCLDTGGGAVRSMLRHRGHGHVPQRCASFTTPCLTTGRGGGSAARGANKRPAGAGAACITRPLLDRGRAWCSPSLVTGHLGDADEVSIALVSSGEACGASHTLVTLHPYAVQRSTEGQVMVSTSSPPGPRARFPGAHLLAFSRDRLGFVCRLKHDYGDVVAFRLGPERTVLLSHPAHLHEVLVRQHRAFLKGRRGDVSQQFLGLGLLNSEGAVHQRQRHLLQPAFHRHRLAQYATVMTTAAARLRQSWHDGETLDIVPAMRQVTLAIVAKTLFDADVEEEATTMGRALTTLLQLSP